MTRKLIPIPNQRKNKKMDEKKEEKKPRKTRETVEKTPVRLAADAYDKIRVLMKNEDKVIQEAKDKHMAKIDAVYADLSPEAQEIYKKL